MRPCNKQHKTHALKKVYSGKHGRKQNNDENGHTAGHLTRCCTVQYQFRATICRCTGGGETKEILPRSRQEWLAGPTPAVTGVDTMSKSQS